MKKIILLILTLAFSFNTYSQLANESFEAAVFPPTTPANWAVFDNGVSGTPNVNWATNGTANSGVKAAFMTRPGSMPTGSISEDYLATPAINVPINGQLKFFTRTLLAGIQPGTKYIIKVKLTSAGPQNDPVGYNTIQEWTDANFLTNNLVYEEKTLDLTAGTQVYIAFVLQQTGTGSSVGNRWLVDDVKVVEACNAPDISTYSAGAITNISATLGWGAVVGAVGYQIENVLASAVPTGTLTALSATNSYPQTVLTATTDYQFFVRSDCGGGNLSPWSGPFYYTTTIDPPVCGGNFADSGTNTANYSNNENITTVIIPITPTDKVTVTFSSFSTEFDLDTLKIYDNDSATPGSLIGTYSGTNSPGSITATNPTGALTFVFVSNEIDTSAGWLSTVTCGPPPTCQKPLQLQTAAVLSTTATLSWGAINGAVTYDIFYQACGLPVPTAATAPSSTSNTNTINLTLLSANTCYDFYVRTVCAGSDLSVWSNPVNATTQSLAAVCGGNYLDSGGLNNSYSDNENIITRICPDNPGEKVTVTFTAFATEVGFDGMYIYNGSVIDPAFKIPSNNPIGVGFPRVLTEPGAYWGRVIPGPFTSTSADGCLTFVFKSEVTGEDEGWETIITCAFPPTCEAPIDLKTSSTLPTNSTLSWTQPTNPDGSIASSWNVIALPCGSPAPAINNPSWINTNTNSYPFDTLTANTCYDFYVQAICSSTDSSFISRLESSFTPLTCLNNFYDTGGQSDTYADEENNTTTICPTLSTDTVIVTFTAFDVEPFNDGLYVFNGNTINAPQIIQNSNSGATVPGGLDGPFWGTTNPGPFRSTSPDGCLTFKFISDSSQIESGWEANVSCVLKPTCSAPILLSANNITSTSATLSWSQPQNTNGSTATSWEILILPAGSPLPTANGTPITGNPSIQGSLTPGTAYTYYVRAVCSSTEKSYWYNFNFSTAPVNDECTNATFAIVNQDLNCLQTTQGVFTGSTVSSQASTCGGVNSNDVWFSFTATAATHIISFNNYNGSAVLSYTVYQAGNCGALTQIGCDTASGLVAGNTYLIRVHYPFSSNETLTFDLCIGTLPCATAPAFCTGQTVSYDNTVDVPSLGEIGCLQSSPNPAFFFLQVSQAGPLNYFISQQNSITNTPQDVDYVAWGPFTDLATACTGIPANPLDGIRAPFTPTTAQGCTGTLHACSYDRSATEIICIPNAQLCEVYVVMITNYSNKRGTITFTQTNSGGGTTSCFPINTFNYSKSIYCKDEPNPTPVLSNGAGAGTYTATPPGLVIDPITGTINLLQSLPGEYIITSTTLTSTGGACTSIPSIKTVRTVIITAPASATIAYVSSVYCSNIDTQQSVILTGTQNGNYSASPAGLSINPLNGNILPIASTPEIYTVTYTVPPTGGCPAFTNTTIVEIKASPIVFKPSDVNSCTNYVLPAIPVGNYYSQSGGIGAIIPAGTNITTSQPIYIYASNGNCTDEKLFTITIGTGSTAVVGFSYTSPVCRNTTSTTATISPTATGAPLTSGGTFSCNNPALIINATTGEIDLASPSGNYTITYSVPANITTCLVANSAQATLTINPIVPSVTGFSYASPVCRNVANLTPSKATGFTTGGTYSAIPSGLVIDAATGSVSSSSLSGSYTIKYEVAADNNGNVCRAAGFSTTTLVIEPMIVATSTLNYSTTNIFCKIGLINPTPTITTTYTYDGVASIVVPTPNPNGTYIYTVTPPGLPGLDIIANTGEINLATSLPGTYTITYTATGTTPNCYSGGSAQVIVTINAPSSQTANFSFTSPVCKSDVTNPTPIKSLGFANGGSYSSGAGLSINASTGEITLASSTPGDYTINYLLPPSPSTCEGGVSSSATITISPVIVPTFTTITVCQGTIAQTLPANYTIGTTVITGTWSSSLISTTTVGISTYTFTPNTGQCAGNGTLTVNVTAPSVNTTFATISACQGTSAPTLPANYTSGTTIITGNWSPPIVSTSTVGTSTYTFTPNPGQCAGNGVLTVNVIAPNILPTFTPYGQICEGDALPVLPITSNNAIIGTWSTTGNTSAAGTIVSNFVPNSGQCALPTSMSIIVAPNPTFTISGACQGGAFTLEVSALSGNATYSWLKGTMPVGSNSTTLAITEIADYYCTVTENGCSKKSLPFTPNDIICSVQKGISPNNDGLNDYFDLSAFDVNKLEIFNRYGMLVYAKSGYKKEWFGQADSGETLPDGTYFYMISLNKGDAKTGWIYINKENK